MTARTFRHRKEWAWPHRILPLIFLAVIFLSSAATADDGLAFFETKIRPLLAGRCVKCHGAEKQKGGLRLDSRAAMLAGGETGPALQPANAAESLLMRQIESGEMPPRTEPQPTAQEVAALRRWIDGGAAMPEGALKPMVAADWRGHWAFSPPDRERALAALPAEERERLAPRRALAGVAALEPDAAEVRAHLQAWYRAEDLALADGAALVQWPDRSGHERHLAPTQGAHPNGLGTAPRWMAQSTVGGRAAVRFDERSGLGSPGGRPVPIFGDAPFTLAIVLNLRPRSGGYPNDLVVSFGEFGFPKNPGRPLAGAIGIQRASGANHRLSVVGGWGHDAHLPPGSFAGLYHQPCVITVVKRPGPLAATAEISLNGSPVASLPNWGAAAGSDQTPDFQERQARDFSVMMGSAVAGAGGILGDVAEMVLYSEALTPGQQRGVEAGLAARYRLADLSRAPVAHPVDSFIEARLRGSGLKPAPLASKQTLVRRAYFDLLGLPPTPEQVDNFVNDASPFAWEALITELLSSPRYGERWARHWLDVARYADTAGFETEEYHRNAWRYRDWVIKAFNDDKPYARFVQEQVAADELWPANLEASGGYALPAEQVARMEAQFGTGIYGLGTRIGESRLDAKRLRYEELTDWVDTTGAAFLGLTVGCARCHDHKFDPLSQRDYFQLQAVFSHAKLVDRSILADMQHSNWLTDYPNVLRVADARDEYRRYEQSLAGRAPNAEEQNQLRALREKIGQMVLAVPLAPPGEGVFAPRYDGFYEIPTVTVLTSELPHFVKPVHLLQRGELTMPREEISAALPAALAEASGAAAALPSGFGSRAGFANWLVRPDHPLTARVMVNRIWQGHFGRGLVATPNDFGRMGQPPTHPELLDFLATEFIARGWSIKAMHRFIMTSAAYRRGSLDAAAQDVAALARTDPDNRQLSHFPRRRLEGEAVWDTLHAVAGTLNLEMGGLPFAPPLAAEESSALRYAHQWGVSSDPRQHTRRGIYMVSLRAYRFPLFDVFDAPNNGVSTGARDDTTVAPQALWLLNNPRAWQQALHLAARVVRDTGDHPGALVTKLWRIALGRPPTPAERDEATALLENLARTDSGRPLENTPPELASLPAPRASALTKLCLSIFSHHEFLYID